MKIVINIPEKYLNSNIIDVTLFTGSNNIITDVNVEDEYAEFQVLPKGHGRLIDADTYRKDMMNSREFNFFEILDMQSTIVEADKEAKNEDSN